MGVQALKQPKQPALLVRIQAQAIIRNREHDLGGRGQGVQLHQGRVARAVVLEGVAEQVVHHRAQIFGRKQYRYVRVNVYCHLGVGAGQQGLQVELYPGHYLGQQYVLGGLVLRLLEKKRLRQMEMQTAGDVLDFGLELLNQDADARKKHHTLYTALAAAKIIIDSTKEVQQIWEYSAENPANGPTAAAAGITMGAVQTAAPHPGTIQLG